MLAAHRQHRVKSQHLAAPRRLGWNRRKATARVNFAAAAVIC